MTNQTATSNGTLPLFGNFSSASMQLNPSSSAALELSILMANIIGDDSTTTTPSPLSSSGGFPQPSETLEIPPELDFCAAEFASDDENRSLTDNLTRFIYTVLMPTVCLFGSIGASISLFIFTRKQMRSSLNTYLAALSFFDLILLSMSVIIYPSMNLCLQEGHKGIVCHFFWNSSLVTYPISLMAQMASVWTCVAITVDRFLAVQYPLHMRAWCTLSQAKRIIFFIFLVTILYKMPSFFELTLDECGRLRTTDLRKHSLYIVIYNTYGYLLLLLVIPFFVIIILNVFVILAVRRANSQRQQLQIVMRRRSLTISAEDRKQFSASNGNVKGSSSMGGGTGNAPSSANGSISASAPGGNSNNINTMLLHKSSGAGGSTHSPAHATVSYQSVTAELDSKCTKMATITIMAFLVFNSLAGMNNVIEAFELSFPLETYRIPIGNLLVCVNSASNILIYSIFGRRFRKMCAQLFCSCPNSPCAGKGNGRKNNYESLLRPTLTTTSSSNRTTV